MNTVKYVNKERYFQTFKEKEENAQAFTSSFFYKIYFNIIRHLIGL